MKDIRIFVASSKELVAERNQLSYLVLALEDEFEKRGLRVRLSKWEYVDPTMTEARTEDRYLEEMLDCDGVLMLFRRVLGMYTKEEVDKAIAAETAGSSRIKRHLMLFKEGDGEPTPELAKWRATLPEGTYGTFADMDGLKAHFLHFVEELSGLALQDVATTEDRTVSAFLAADGELVTDRNAFADAVLNLNDMLVRRGVRVRLRFYDPERHGELLDRSEMALVLYHTRCGEFGPEALKESFVRSKGNENPRRLYVFFRDPDGRPLDGAFAAFRDGFSEAFGSAPCRFENVDTLSLNFLFSVESVLGDNGGTFVKLDGRMVMADGQEVGDLTKLPMLRKNAGLAALLGKMDDVSARFSAQREKCERSPQDDGLYVELLDISAEKNRLQDQIDRELRQSFNLAKRMAAVSIAQVDATVARARELMEEGKVKEALEVLDGASSALKRRRLLRRAADRSAAEELEIKELKAGCDIEYFRVDAVMAYTELLFKERFAKAESIYKSLVADVEEYAANCTVGHKADLDRHLAGILRRFAKLYDEIGDTLNPIPLLEKALELYRAVEIFEPDSCCAESSEVYMILADKERVNNKLEAARSNYELALDFFRKQDKELLPKLAHCLVGLAQLNDDTNKLRDSEGQHQEALKIRLELMRTSFEAYAGDVAASYNYLANHHLSLNKLCEAEAEYNEAIRLLRGLSLKNPDKFMSELAASLNDIAYLYTDMNDLDAAEKEHYEALEIHRQLAETNPAKFDEYVATSLNNLASLHMDMNDSDEAEKEHREALEIRRRLAETNPARFDEYVATSLNNLASLHKNMNNLDVAEKECREALEIRRRLAETNPAKFDEHVATSLNNLANLHMSMNLLNDAENEHREALEVRRRLAETNPAKFNEYVATSLNTLAYLHMDMNRLDEAEKEYRESLEIRRQSAETNPAKFDEYVATSLNNLAYLHVNMNHLDEAEKEYRESLEIRRRLAETNPAKFDEYVAISLNNLAALYKNINRLDEAEKEYHESLEIRRWLAETNPAKFDEYVATSLNNLSVFHKNMDHFVESEEECREALEIRRRLAGTNPAKFDEHVATSLNNLANLHAAMNLLNEAENEHREALEIRRRLAETNPAKFNEYVATSLNNLAVLHMTMYHLDEAEKEHREALEIRRRLVEANPAKFKASLKQTLNNIEKLYRKMNRLEDADRIQFELCELRDKGV